MTHEVTSKDLAPDEAGERGLADEGARRDGAAVGQRALVV